MTEINIKCNHELYKIIHRDCGKFVMEFCTDVECDYRKKLTGKECKKWQNILRKINGGD